MSSDAPMRGNVSNDRGRQIAFDRLFADSRLELLRLARLIVDDLHAAEDITQDAFLGLYRNWDNLRDEDKALDYLRSAVINNARSVLRRRVVARVMQFRLSPPSESPMPEIMASASEDERRVRSALRIISRRQREALVLRYYSDLSYDEIARTLKVSTGTVKSSISRGLRNLARELGEKDE